MMEIEADPLEGSSYSLNVTVKAEVRDENENDDEESYNAMQLLELAQSVETEEADEPIILNTTDAILNPKTGFMVCLHCLQELQTNQVSDHMVQEHGYRRMSFKCNICEAHFLERNLFLTHRNKCQPPPKKFRRKTFRQLVREVENTLEYTTEMDALSCPVCFVEIPKFDLKDHLIREHSQEESLTCTICNRTFKSKLTLREHIKLVHESVENSHECPICSQKFRSLKYLSNHKRNVHPVGDKEYRCEVCDKLFKSRLSVHQHRKSVHPPAAASVPCPQCHKQFKARANLRQHIRVSHR